MTVQERILTIRLLTRAARHPEYTKQLGIELNAVDLPPSGPEMKENMQEPTDM